MSAPRRIRLSRAKGWRLPPNTLNVARPGRLGNPFIVGKHGTREECVHLYALMLAGYFCLSNGPSIEAQELVRYRALDAARAHKGEDVACWCALDGKPCHGDVWLAVATKGLSSATIEPFLIPGRWQP